MGAPHLEVVKVPDLEFSLFSAKVLSGKDLHFRILTEQGVFEDAKLAASCLVAPAKGSEVLIAAGKEQYYILSVLTHPAPTLTLKAKAIELDSERLNITNKATVIKTNQLRFDVRRLLSFAKRAYVQFGQLWQKTDATYLESKHYKLKTRYLAEQTQGLRFSEAEVISDKAKVSAIQADKFLVN